LIGRVDPELCGLFLARQAGGLIEQDGRQAALGAGDFTFTELSRPFRMAGRLHDFVSVIFPRVLLTLDRPESRKLTGIRFDARQSHGALVSTLIRRLVDDAEGFRGRGTARIGSAVLDLVTDSLTARLGHPRTPPAGSGNAALLLRVRTYIEERLGDPALSPATIAAAHHISVRALYNLFATDGTAVAAWVRARRLERCRRDLLDPTRRSTPVSATATRWGFTDPAHFSRVFRDAYGMPPGEYRRTLTG
jgi:AraC-like DNA-binding protein